MVSLTKTKFNGELLVKIKGMGKITIDGFGAEQELTDYVFSAYTFLKEDGSPVASYDSEETAKNEWKVIRFSAEERVLEVEKLA